MRVAIDQLAVKDCGYFVNSVTKEKTTIKDRDFCIARGDIFAIHINDAVFKFC
ncbi:hypothetical protein D3C80_2212300 [compost metagenome]